MRNQIVSNSKWIRRGSPVKKWFSFLDQHMQLLEETVGSCGHIVGNEELITNATRSFF